MPIFNILNALVAIATALFRIMVAKKIAVTAFDNSLLSQAQKLAKQLHLPYIEPTQNIDSFPLLLTLTPERLEIRESANKNSKPIFVDFLAAPLNYRLKHGGRKQELLAKAIGIKNKKNLTVIDATAGFGVDAFILASLGCKVIMLERSCIISALLADGLKRLKQHHLNLSLKHTETADYLNNIIANDLPKPDVIYLDPMYPQRSKSALNKKNMRILHEIVGADNDASQLLNLALKCAKHKVVVKRPRLAEYLGWLKPNLQFAGNGSSRYDVYLTPK